MREILFVAAVSALLVALAVGFVRYSRFISCFMAALNVVVVGLAMLYAGLTLLLLVSVGLATFLLSGCVVCALRASTDSKVARPMPIIQPPLLSIDDRVRSDDAVVTAIVPLGAWVTRIVNHYRYRTV